MDADGGKPWFFSPLAGAAALLLVVAAGVVLLRCPEGPPIVRTVAESAGAGSACLEEAARESEACHADCDTSPGCPAGCLTQLAAKCEACGVELASEQSSLRELYATGSAPAAAQIQATLERAMQKEELHIAGDGPVLLRVGVEARGYPKEISAAGPTEPDSLDTVRGALRDRVFPTAAAEYASTWVLVEAVPAF
jgi:hypothetical protein